MTKPQFQLHNIQKAYRCRRGAGGAYFYPDQWTDWEAVEEILTQVNAVDPDDRIVASDHVRVTTKNIEYRAYWR